jgi:hypothetical protein
MHQIITTLNKTNMCDLTNAMEQDGMNTRERDLMLLNQLKMKKKAIDDKIVEVQKKIMDENIKLLDEFFDCFE